MSLIDASFVSNGSSSLPSIQKKEAGALQSAVVSPDRRSLTEAIQPRPHARGYHYYPQQGGALSYSEQQGMALYHSNQPLLRVDASQSLFKLNLEA